LTRRPIDLSTQAIEVALRPLCDYLACDQCNQLLRERINNLVAQWSIVKVCCFCAAIYLLITFSHTIDRERSSWFGLVAGLCQKAAPLIHFYILFQDLVSIIHSRARVSYSFVCIHRPQTFVSDKVLHCFCHIRFPPNQHPQLFISFLNGTIHASHFPSFPCIIVSVFVAFIHVVHPPFLSLFFMHFSPVHATSSPMESTYKTNR
jgi:hypothetical protein